jgi:hypothetical protein
MQQITAITDDPIQTSGIILVDGSVVQMTLQYVPGNPVGSWWYSLSYGNWQADLMRIVVSPNMIRKYRRVIPFGLCVKTIDGYEVVNQSDWISGRATMFSLSNVSVNGEPSDIQKAETLILKTIPALLGNFIS